MKTLFTLFLLAAGITAADEPLAFASITTTKGVAYKSVKVSRFDEKEVRFIHEQGVATVPLAEMPEEVQKIFGFAPIKETAPKAAGERQRFAKMTTVSGKEYEDVLISKVTQLEIRFTHAHGIASVPMADLPPDLQKLFGFDAVAADFEMINVQEERRQALIAEEKRKADQAELLKRQEMEHKAIKAIELTGVKLCLTVREIKADGVSCIGMKYRLVEMTGRRANGKKTAAKKKMSGEYELTEEMVPLSGSEPWSDENLVTVHGMDMPVVGQQIVQVVYPCGHNAKGMATHYAMQASLAYSIFKEWAAKPKP